MARRRLRGRNFRWGAGFEGKPPFSGAKLKALSDHCHDFIEAARQAASAPEKFRVARYAFELFGHGFLLRYEPGEVAWVLDIVSWPQRSTGHAKRARSVQPPRRNRFKRNLYSPVLNFVRSQSRQFRVNNDCPRLFDSIVWIAGRVRYKAA
jgi:hypothetical protein